LLLNRNEIERLDKRVSQEGRTMVPLKMYFKQGMVKVELAIARGKNVHDKRQSTAKRDAQRQMQQALGRRR
jgi:SsrA-binding protein